MICILLVMTSCKPGDKKNEIVNDDYNSKYDFDFEYLLNSYNLNSININNLNTEDVLIKLKLSKDDGINLPSSYFGSFDYYYDSQLVNDGKYEPVFYYTKDGLNINYVELTDEIQNKNIIEYKGEFFLYESLFTKVGDSEYNKSQIAFSNGNNKNFALGMKKTTDFKTFASLSRKVDYETNSLAIDTKFHSEAKIIDDILHIFSYRTVSKYDGKVFKTHYFKIDNINDENIDEKNLLNIIPFYYNGNFYTVCIDSYKFSEFDSGKSIEYILKSENGIDYKIVSKRTLPYNFTASSYCFYDYDGSIYLLTPTKVLMSRDGNNWAEEASSVANFYYTDTMHETKDVYKNTVNIKFSGIPKVEKHNQFYFISNEHYFVYENCQYEDIWCDYHYADIVTDWIYKNSYLYITKNFKEYIKLDRKDINNIFADEKNIYFEFKLHSYYDLYSNINREQDIFIGVGYIPIDKLESYLDDKGGPINE